MDQKFRVTPSYFLSPSGGLFGFWVWPPGLLEGCSLLPPVSLDAPLPEGERSIAETLGAEEQGFLDFENTDLLRRSMASLSEKQREVIELRFFENLSQREVAQRLGVSQMSVSRAERGALAQLRRASEMENNGRR